MIAYGTMSVNSETVSFTALPDTLTPYLTVTLQRLAHNRGKEYNKNMDIILASQSPRRRELMELIGLPFRVEVSHVEENVPVGTGPAETVKLLALQKAQAVANLYPNACIIGADTIVDLDGVIFGKPHTPEKAKEYLNTLSGKTHTVHTGLAVITPDGTDVRTDETRVTFAQLTPGEIDAYVASGDPLDKAGSYGIQGPFGVHVPHIEGSYFNVIGLPVHLLYAMLTDNGVIPKP